MSSNEQPFGPWADAMEKAGAVDPRNGRPSWTQLAARAEVSVSAVTNMVSGKTKAKPETVQKVAGALRVRPEVVSSWLGGPRPVRGPYVPVPESSLLAPHEREALDLLIRAIARGREEAGDPRGDTAPMNEAPEPVRLARADLRRIYDTAARTLHTSGQFPASEVESIASLAVGFGGEMLAAGSSLENAARQALQAALDASGHGDIELIDPPAAKAGKRRAEQGGAKPEDLGLAARKGGLYTPGDSQDRGER